MTGTQIALAASAREWPDRLHRYLLDHGGGNVTSRVLGTEQALAGNYQVLLIDDVCSFLNPRLVASLRRTGVEVVGVFDPGDGSDAKRRLLECGISDVIESDAEPEEILAAARTAVAHRTERPGDAEQPQEPLGWTLGVCGTSEGVGTTEVAIGLAQAAAASLKVTLVDHDPHWPSVAPRLDLPLHPNVRTAIDFALHQPDRLDRAFHQIDGLTVVGGTADGGAAAPVSHVEAGILLEALAGRSRLLVADLGPFNHALRSLIPRLDTLAVVGTGDPVGVARLFRILEPATELAAEGSVVVVVNKVPARAFYRDEIRAELMTGFPNLAVVTLPYDRKLAEAAWEGEMAPKGPFRNALGRAADLISETVAT